MSKLNAAETSGSSPQTMPRGLRIEQAATYSGLSPFFIEECIRSGELLSFGGPGSGVSAAHIVTREHLDEFIDKLVERAEVRRKKEKAA